MQGDVTNMATEAKARIKRKQMLEKAGRWQNLIQFSDYLLRGVNNEKN